MTADELSRDEIALYDRQIRLWGMATQLRLRSAKLLLVNLGSVGMEAVKNLVLGGIHSIEILDDSAVKIEDFGAQFFLPNDESIVGQTKLPHVIDSIKELNSRVEISINTNSVSGLIKTNPEYFLKFDLIVATELDKASILDLNQITRNFKIPLYLAGIHGMFGYIITDLIDHACESEKELGNQRRKAGTELSLNKTITNVKLELANSKEILTIHDEFHPVKDIFESKLLPKQLNKRRLRRLSPSLPIILALLLLERRLDIDVEDIKAALVQLAENLGLPSEVITPEYLKYFRNQSFTEFAPTSAIIGGCLSQDIIQFLSKKESPINNVLIFDGLKSEMPIYTL